MLLLIQGEDENTKKFEKVSELNKIYSMLKQYIAARKIET